MEKLFAHLRNQWMGALALFIVLAGGTAWAAGELDRNDVRSKHIAKGQVKGVDLAGDAVSTPKVKNGSLLGEDFAAGQLPQGPPGVQGETGPAGSPDTPAQVLAKIQEVDGAGSGLDADQIDGQDSSAFPRKIVEKSVTWDPPNLTPGSCIENTVALGMQVQPTDHLVVSELEPGGTPFRAQMSAFVHNRHTVYAVICNNGLTDANVPSLTLNVLVLR